MTRHPLPTTLLKIVILIVPLIATCAGSPPQPPPRSVTSAGSPPSPTTPPQASGQPSSTGSRGPATPADRIAFVLGRDDGADEVIVTIRPDGTDEWRVPVDRPSPNEGPTWVPGRSTLLFDSGRTGNIDLFRVDVPNGSVAPITATQDRLEGFPTVSPDGSSIVFDNSDRDASLGLWRMDLDGANARRLLAPPELPAFDSAPAFSPDGRWIAFVRKRSQRAPHAQEAAFVMRADGTSVRQLTDWDLDVGRIRWAPDASYLVFSDKAENGNENVPVDVWHVSPDGTALRRITRNGPGVFAYDPELSPDGSRMVYVAWRRGLTRNELWTADPDGGNATRIWSSPDGTFIEWPAWGDRSDN